jgi:hypothetical protein
MKVCKVSLVVAYRWRSKKQCSLGCSRVNKVNHQLCRKSPGAVGYLCSIAKLFYTQLSINSSLLAKFQIVTVQPSSFESAYPISHSRSNIPCPPSPPNPPAYFGFSIRSGTTGLTSNTAFKSSFTTSSVPFLPASLIPLIWSSASLFASSSAFLFPLVC